jgi:DNA repair photolyase
MMGAIGLFYFMKPPRHPHASKKKPADNYIQASEYNDLDNVEQKQFTTTTRGRGAGFNPVNRFEKTVIEKTPEDIHEEDLDPGKTVPTEYIPDNSRSILSRNDSPDIPYTFSINPYRGCEHGCIYCYARPSHEYFGLSSGLDFETKIMVKFDAPGLLEHEFRKPSWKAESICVSGNTDCYQPAERQFKITRELLKMFLKYQNSVRIITKNYLVTRDLDILGELARKNLVGVMISITTLDTELARKLEPRTSRPDNRLRAIQTLAHNGIPVGVMTAPVIPGLTDHEIPEILRQASEAGAHSAGYTMIRLTYALKELFKDWLDRQYPTKSEKVLNSIRSVRNGQLTSPEFGKRMRGEGAMAEHVSRTFKLFAKRYGLDTDSVLSRAPAPFLRNGSDQIGLF